MTLPKRETWVKGQCYESRQQAMSCLGVSYNTLVAMMEAEGQVVAASIPFEWNGFTFSNRPVAAKALGISPHAIRYRIRMGYKSDADMQRVHRRGENAAVKQTVVAVKKAPEAKLANQSEKRRRLQAVLEKKGIA